MPKVTETIANLAVVAALVELLHEKGVIDRLLDEGVITREEWKQRTAKEAGISEDELDKILASKWLRRLIEGI